MEEEKELRFVRLRTMVDDLVGYVSYHEEYITIECPLRIEIETYFDEGRQTLSLHEFLPQAVVEIKEIEIGMDDVLFITPVKPEFIDQFDYASDFFYNNISKLSTKTEKPKISAEDLNETTQKVVSILEAMANKKDKPVH